MRKEKGKITKEMLSFEGWI